MADSRLTEKQPKPDVSTENSHRVTADTALTEDVAITNIDTKMAQGISKTNTTPTLVLAPTMDFFKQMGIYSQQQVSSVRPGLEAFQDGVGPQTTAIGPPEPLRAAQCGGKGIISWVKRGKLLPQTAFQVSPCLLQVPAVVRDIHQRLVSQGTVDARLRITILKLAEEYPAHVALTLLRCAPSCDRYGAELP